MTRLLSFAPRVDALATETSGRNRLLRRWHTTLAASDLAAVLRAIDSEFGLARALRLRLRRIRSPSTLNISITSGRVVSIGSVSGCKARRVRCSPPWNEPTRRVGRLRQQRAARGAGFDEVSLDLIYGTPGETDGDWKASIEAALSAEPTHISAYSLIVEPGTGMARQLVLEYWLHRMMTSSQTGT